MDFFKSAADSVTKAVDFVVDKNRKAAMMNRLKIVIRNEKEAQAHAYAQLGKYYYQNMRDPENGDTEPFCLAIDTAGRRLKRAYAKLDELAVPTAPQGDGPSPEGGEDDGEDDGDFSSGEPAESSAELHPDEEFRPDAEHEEAAADDEDFLHPFTVVPNDKKEPSGETEEEKK